MNKIFLFGFFAFLLISCSSKEDDIFEANDMEGSWEVVEVLSEGAKLSGKYESSLGTIPIDSDISVSGKDYNMMVTFLSKSNQISTDGSLTGVISISLPLVGKKEYEQKISEVPATKGKWKIENEKLITEYQGQTSSIDIVIDNKSEITLSYPLEESIGNLLSGFQLKDAKIKGTIKLKLRKK